MLRMQTLDLTKDVPRSPFADLDGFLWLPRMIDKARAFYAGKHGEYTPYPCPGDQNFLKHFGLDAQALGTVIRNGATDAEIAAWVATSAKDPSPAAKAAFRRSQLEPYANPLMRLAVVLLRWKNGAAIRAGTPGVDVGSLNTFAKMVAAEEGHPLP